jgi:cytochrome c
LNKIGPSPAGVLGRKSGTEARLAYSAALKAATIPWDKKTFD